MLAPDRRAAHGWRPFHDDEARLLQILDDRGREHENVRNARPVLSALPGLLRVGVALGSFRGFRLPRCRHFCSFDCSDHNEAHGGRQKKEQRHAGRFIGPVAARLTSPRTEAASQAGPVRHGDFRRHRRPDQATGHSRALQPVPHRRAAGAIRADRRRPARRNREELGRQSPCCVAELCRQRKRRVQCRPSRRGGLDAARVEHVVHIGRYDRPRALREPSRRPRQTRRPPQCDLLSRHCGSAFRRRGGATRQSRTYQ